MALRNIFTDESIVLRKKCKPVLDFDEKLWQLLDDMKETMHKNDGCGLAANQVGVLKQVIVIDACGLQLELINPTIIKTSGEQESEEGCLSVCNYTGIVKRPLKVTVSAYDRYGNNYKISSENFLTTVFCHEIDHLNGILFTDKAITLYEKVLNKNSRNRGN